MAASDTRKPQNQLIYDLIEESNPGFKAAYPLGSLQFTNVTAITVDSSDPQKKDTQVTCKGVNGSGIIGQVTLKYRRIDLGNFFRNMNPILDDWQPTGVTSLPRSIWTVSFSKKFGLSVVDADWPSNYGGLPESPVQVVNVIATCLCYKGSFGGFVWKRGKRPMSNIATDANRALSGRLYPGGNDFTTPGRKPQGEWQVYGMDASSIKQYMDWGTSGSTPAVGNSTTGFQAILAWLNANTGRTNWSNKDASVEGGICGITWYTYTLPSTSAPEANNARFNRVTVLQSAANSWFAGKILIHWNA